MEEEQKSAFERLIQAKKRFLIPATCFFFTFYFMLPVTIVCFPQQMNREVFFGLTLAWVYAFAQFVMVWLLGILYYVKCKQFDRLAKRAGGGRRPQ